MLAYVVDRLDHPVEDGVLGHRVQVSFETGAVGGDHRLLALHPSGRKIDSIGCAHGRADPRVGHAGVEDPVEGACAARLLIWERRCGAEHQRFRGIRAAQGRVLPIDDDRTTPAGGHGVELARLEAYRQRRALFPGEGTRGGARGSWDRAGLVDLCDPGVLVAQWLLHVHLEAQLNPETASQPVVPTDQGDRLANSQAVRDASIVRLEALAGSTHGVLVGRVRLTNQPAGDQESERSDKEGAGETAGKRHQQSRTFRPELCPSPGRGNQHKRRV